MFLVNSRFPLFSAATPRRPPQGCRHGEAPLLPKLRGHFAEFLNHSSPDRLSILYLTTCVGLGYGPHNHSLEAFLGSIGSPTSPLRVRITSHPSIAVRIYLDHGLHAYTTIHQVARLPSCVTPSLGYYQIRSPASTTRHHPKVTKGCFRRVSITDSPWARLCGYGNINPLSIDYACRPRLRSRLTLGGLTWPRNPWSSGGGVFHSSFATHACILTRVHSTTGHPAASQPNTTLPYPTSHKD